MDKIRKNHKSRLFHYFKNIDYLIYKRKHLFFYIIIGGLSIYFELLCRKFLLINSFDNISASLISLFIGVFLAFTLNFFLNFNVPKFFFYRALLYFFIISIASYLCQFFIKINLDLDKMDYNESRFIIAGLFFLIGYIFHIKFTFKDKRTVGIAIYCNKEEKNKSILEKIGQYPDFIHLDIVDESYFNKKSNIDLSKVNEIRNLWPYHDIDIHIMSRYPLKYISNEIREAKTIYFHYEINENLDEVIKSVLRIGCEPGLVLHSKNEYKDLDSIIFKFREVLILSIEKPGFSGQHFYDKSYSLIKRINKTPKRKNIKLCVDGGIKSFNINNFNCEKIVSASEILNSENPKRKIMKLQTLSRYEK